MKEGGELNQEGGLGLQKNRQRKLFGEGNKEKKKTSCPGEPEKAAGRRRRKIGRESFSGREVKKKRKKTSCSGEPEKAAGRRRRRNIEGEAKGELVQV